MNVIYTRYMYSYWVPWQSTVDGLLFLLTMLVLLIPESPKILIGRRKFDEARGVLARIAKENKVKADVS